MTASGYLVLVGDVVFLDRRLRVGSFTVQSCSARFDLFRVNGSGGECEPAPASPPRYRRCRETTNAMGSTFRQ